MPPTFLDSSWPNDSGKIGPDWNELTDFEKSSFLSSIFPTFWQACWNSISPVAVLLLELERIYESLELISDSGCEQAKSFEERLSQAIFYDVQGRTCNDSCGL